MDRWETTKIIVNGIKYNVNALVLEKEPYNIPTLHDDRYVCYISKLIVEKDKSNGENDDCCHTVKPVLYYNRGWRKNEEPKEGSLEYDILQTAIAGIGIYKDTRDIKGVNEHEQRRVYSNDRQ